MVAAVVCQDFGDSPIPTTDDPFGGSFIGVSYIASAALENGERGTRSICNCSLSDMVFQVADVPRNTKNRCGQHLY